MTQIPGTGTPDACDFLDEDHQLVDSMFDEYEALMHKKPADGAARKRDLAADICAALKVHARLEEEIFYPALRGWLDDPMVLHEAQVEHDGAKALIAKLESGNAADPLFDARIKVLGEYIKHHVREVRLQLFPQARSASGIDLAALKEQMEARQTVLVTEQAALAISTRRASQYPHAGTPAPQ